MTAPDVLVRARRELDGLTSKAVNGFHHLSGTPLGEVAASAKSRVWARDNVALYRYDHSLVTKPPVLLVMSLATRPTIFDLAPGSSLVADLLAAGHDVFLLDWGVPTAVEATNTLETYCDDYLPRTIRAVAQISGAPDVTVIAYCLGGVLALLAAAGNEDLPLRDLVCIATPVDFSHLGPMAKLLERGRLEAHEVLDATGNVPASTMLEGFRLTHPMNFLARYANLWQSLAHRRSLASYQAVIGWSSSHIPFPGAVLAQIVELFLRRRCLVAGVVPLAGREVRLGDISVPVLHVVGDKDNLVPDACTAPFETALAGADVTTLRQPAGHAGLLLGSAARTRFVPHIITWLAER